MELLDGLCLSVDAHTTDLLELYTLHHNRWVKEQLDSRESPYPPVEVAIEEMARRILLQFLLPWAERQKAVSNLDT